MWISCHLTLLEFQLLKGISRNLVSIALRYSRFKSVLVLNLKQFGMSRTKKKIANKRNQRTMSGSHLSGKPTVFISTTSSTAFLRAVGFYRYYDMKHDTANVLLHHALHDHDNYTQKHLLDKCSERLKFSFHFSFFFLLFCWKNLIHLHIAVVEKKNRTQWKPVQGDLPFTWNEHHVHVNAMWLYYPEQRRITFTWSSLWHLSRLSHRLKRIDWRSK